MQLPEEPPISAARESLAEIDVARLSTTRSLRFTEAAKDMQAQPRYSFEPYPLPPSCSGNPGVDCEAYRG